MSVIEKLTLHIQKVKEDTTNLSKMCVSLSAKTDSELLDSAQNTIIRMHDKISMLNRKLEGLEELVSLLDNTVENKGQVDKDKLLEIEENFKKYLKNNTFNIYDMFDISYFKLLSNDDIRKIVSNCLINYASENNIPIKELWVSLFESGGVISPSA